MIIRMLLFLLIYPYGLQAQQSSYAKGYIIKQPGDTLLGYVKDRTPEPFVKLYDQIKFKKSLKKWKKKYGVNDILGYGYSGNHFLSVPFRTETDFFKTYYFSDPSASRKFLKVISYSNRLIYFEEEYVDSFTLNVIPYFHRPSTKQFVRVTQGLLGFKKKRLSEFFSDCPDIIKEINSENSSISGIIDLYEYYLVNCN